MPKILRVFRAEAKAGMEEEFRAFFLDVALPLVRSHSGLVSARVGLPDERAPRSFLMVSVWSSVEALQEFAGSDWRNAVIDPREEHLLAAVQVHHYIDAGA